MFLNRKYYVKQVEVDFKGFYQVVCVKDWGKRQDMNGIVGVSRLFKRKEHAERFLNMLEAAQKARAMNYVVQQETQKTVEPKRVLSRPRTKTRKRQATAIADSHPIKETEDEQRI